MSALFLDPLGQHLIITTVPKQGDNNSAAEIFYLHRKTTKLKQVFKLENCYILKILLL